MPWVSTTRRATCRRNFLAAPLLVLAACTPAQVPPGETITEALAIGGAVGLVGVGAYDPEIHDFVLMRDAEIVRCLQEP